jgi:hypothetical protein|eukprot:COSAG06_NODE_1076_length_10808_cov_102.033523_5_plen_70_part_00
MPTFPDILFKSFGAITRTVPPFRLHTSNQHEYAHATRQKLEETHEFVEFDLAVLRLFQLHLFHVTLHFI